MPFILIGGIHVMLLRIQSNSHLTPAKCILKMIQYRTNRANDKYFWYFILFASRYKLQVDVVNQLGQRIEQQLQAQESAMSTMSRTEASRSRATHVKLTRDFRRVEATFKNLQLEVRRKKAVADAARREREEEERGRMEEMGGSGQARRMQMQIEEDVSFLKIEFFANLLFLFSAVERSVDC